ncbi:MAG TPA: histidine kinase [Solirubrobacteraceae bacterium]|nr:histidine kinase [Solirubrobacteraceae bacterium]
MADERGHLKVFIGMAPGVGKTYRMLQEGAAEADSGRDVAVGYLEPHGRAETLAQAEGLEIVPRRPVVYRGTPLQEMDLPAVLARKPELCLIDELAHTNAPGVEHEKRYEDVRDVIEAGIDVFSTVNVQHLESLNDQVTQLTGARVRETIPDEVLSMADEVVLIDLTPEALIGRLRAGKVYPSERVPAALNNFFKIENLAALRETALRQVAEDVEIKRLVREPLPLTRRDEEGLPAPPEAGPQPIAERLLALATLAPQSERVVRRAWRSAQRLDAELDVLVVRPPGREPNASDRERLEALRRLVSMLGARLRVEEGEDVAAVVISVARSLGSTYVLMGTPASREGLRRLGRPIAGRSLLTRLLRGLPGVDIHIVADAAQRRQAPDAETQAYGAENEAPDAEQTPSAEKVPE